MNLEQTCIQYFNFVLSELIRSWLFHVHCFHEYKIPALTKYILFVVQAVFPCLQCYSIPHAFVITEVRL